jgi:hypothetical protein
MEYDVDALITIHGPGEGDHSLLAVDEPVHDGGPDRTRIPSARPSFIRALPQEQGGDWESAVQRVHQVWGLARTPHVLTLELRNDDASASVIFNELPDSESRELQPLVPSLLLSPVLRVADGNRPYRFRYTSDRFEAESGPFRDLNASRGERLERDSL